MLAVKPTNTKGKNVARANERRPARAAAPAPKCMQGQTPRPPGQPGARAQGAATAPGVGANQAPNSGVQHKQNTSNAIEQREQLAQPAPALRRAGRVRHPVSSPCRRPPAGHRRPTRPSRAARKPLGCMRATHGNDDFAHNGVPPGAPWPPTRTHCGGASPGAPTRRRRRRPPPPPPATASHLDSKPGEANEWTTTSGRIRRTTIPMGLYLGLLRPAPPWALFNENERKQLDRLPARRHGATRDAAGWQLAAERCRRRDCRCVRLSPTPFFFKKK